MNTLLIIDGAYLQVSVARELGNRLDMLKFKRLMEKENGAPIRDAFYFTAGEVRSSFLNFLKSANGPKFRVENYEMKSSDYICDFCGKPHTRYMQKGVDVGMTVLMLKMGYRGRYDRLMLVTGDGDFVDAVETVKNELGKEVWLVGYQGDYGISADLQSHADRVIAIDPHLKTLMLEVY